MSETSKKENQFLSVLEKVAQSVFVTRDFHFLYMNPKGLELLACDPSQIYKKKLTDFINRADLSVFVERQVTSSDEEVIVLRLKNCEDEEKWVEISTVEIEWEGEPAVLNIIVDITNYKKTEEKLLIAKKAAEVADRLETSFLANMSHEIRTPLNAIIGFSQLLSQDEISDDLKTKYYKLIDTNSNQLLDLIDDIIDLAQIESGQIKVNKTYFNVNELIKELEIGFREKAEQYKNREDVKIVVKSPVKSDSVFINSDRQRLMQVFNNVLNNALKFTRKGQIVMGYRVLDRFNLEFYVKDTGIGIQKEKQDAVFNRFHQLNSLRNTKVKGTGLGLTISKNILDLLGGTISVESEFGKGATFTFTVPYKSDSHNSRIRSLRKNIPAFLDWSGKVILLAEDEKSNYLFIREALRRTKVQLIWVENGKEAIDILESKAQVDLILMDIQMPVMDGYEAREKIQELGYNTPIIAQTAYAMVDEKEKILSLGFDSYIAKPIQMNMLIELISEFI